MGNCAKILIGSGVDICNPLKASVNERLLVGYLDDIDYLEFDPDNETVITKIFMKEGTSLVVFMGVRSSNRPQMSLQADDISVGFIHQIDFNAYEVDSAHKVQLQAMAARKTFAIYQNPKDSSLGDAVIEALGVNSGLEMSTLTREPQSKDGSFKIQLKTPELAQETNLPNSVFDTDIATTEAMLAEITSGDNLVLSSLASADASPDLVLTFEDASGAAAAMTNASGVTLGGDTVKTVTNIAFAGAVVTITANSAYSAGDNVTVSGLFQSADGVISLNQSPTITA